MAGVAGRTWLPVLRAPERARHCQRGGSRFLQDPGSSPSRSSARERRHEREVESPAKRGRRVRDRQLTGNGFTVEWRGRGPSVGGVMQMAVDAALLDRAGELKRELVAFSQQPRYDRAFSEVLARHGGGSEVLDDHRLMMLWDYFVLEHRLRNGRTIVEQFVDAHAELSRQERDMLLGWRDVVQGPFEVQCRDGEELLRAAKAAYFARVPRPRVSPVSERLAAYAGRW
jgi:hypothetical protein